jgi:ribosome-binding protein aMBF1 (putative translation factor)
MDKKKQNALEAAGFRIGDAEDFLGLTQEERRLVELRVAVSRAVRRLRERQRLTQQQLAARLKSSQSRVAKIEAASADVSLDLLFRGLFAVGGKLDDLSAPANGPPPSR